MKNAYYFVDKFHLHHANYDPPKKENSKHNQYLAIVYFPCVELMTLHEPEIVQDKIFHYVMFVNRLYVDFMQILIGKLEQKI